MSSVLVGEESDFCVTWYISEMKQIEKDITCSSVGLFHDLFRTGSSRWRVGPHTCLFLQSEHHPRSLDDAELFSMVTRSVSMVTGLP